ncbi:hypothetical protein [Lacipirellula parvula]|uniref:Uncharacterized protein n=1 Tax=Lacipirellula parvula TaxID=2650471 RepID=A0A5K7X249_9BACT|nr:hypothetical protein [Lacipirellula parvula]BBO30728.1 hypothetical protein PLANPX_0340 [Lacipirellula parvula]
MTYVLLGQDLHETADGAKKYFSQNYGATQFKCEQSVRENLPLKPTWQAKLKHGYTLCVNVQPSPFSHTLHEFVNSCAANGLAIKLWVAVSHGGAKDSFSAELRKAHENGIGVLQFGPDGTAHEHNRAVPLSLFALRKTVLKDVPTVCRELVKDAEATFLDGAPDKGCQAICQELERVTRAFAETTYNLGMWTAPKSSKTYSSKFFQTDPWAAMLEAMESRIDVTAVRGKCTGFSKQLIVQSRGYTDWRNKVSHAPKTLQQVQARDARLRTMYEATRDLLLEWYPVAKPFKVLK